MVYILAWLAGLCFALCLWIVAVMSVTFRKHSRSDNLAGLAFAAAALLIGLGLLYAAIEVR